MKVLPILGFCVLVYFIFRLVKSSDRLEQEFYERLFRELELSQGEKGYRGKIGSTKYYIRISQGFGVGSNRDGGPALVQSPTFDLEIATKSDVEMTVRNKNLRNQFVHLLSKNKAPKYLGKIALYFGEATDEIMEYLGDPHITETFRQIFDLGFTSIEAGEKSLIARIEPFAFVEQNAGIQVKKTLPLLERLSNKLP